MTARKKLKKPARKAAKNPMRKSLEGFEALSPKERIQKCVEILPEVLGDWESNHPNWKIEVLLWIMDASLKSLRHYIENSEEPGISWDDPFVELHFPVQCVWHEGDDEHPFFELVSGYITEDDVKSLSSARKTLAKILIEQIQVVALQEFTNYTGFEKNGDELRPFFDLFTVEQIRKIFPPEEHDKEINRLFWPLSFGAGHIDYGAELDGESQQDHETCKKALEQLEAIREPLLEVPFEVDGHEFRVITIIEIQPLITDREKKNAYFPIVAGLAIQLVSELSDTECTLEILESLKFSEWPEEQRRQLWEALDALLNGLLENFNPDPDPEMVEAVVSVSAEIRVTVPKNDKQAMNKAMAFLAENLGKGGEVMSMDMRHSGRLLTNHGDEKFLELLAKLEKAKTADEKGKSLEALATSLFQSVPSFSVINRVQTESEEIDLWISNHSDQRPFSDESDVILVECKNWSSKCGKPEFVQLYHKVANRGGRCSIAFLISWNGFAETITTEMLRGSREKLLIVPIDGATIRHAVESGSFLQILKEARQKALMI